MSEIQACTIGDLENYFNEELNEVIRIYKFKVPQPVVTHLTSLMMRTVTSPPSWNPTLTELYIKSLETDKAGQLVLFKEIGDKALIFSGYFPESVEKRSSVDFYIQMGQKGYTQAYYILNNPVYLEMAKAYRDLVKIINEVSDASKHYRTDEILALYAEWLSTKNKVLERKLAKRGFMTKGVNQDEVIF